MLCELYFNKAVGFGFFVFFKKSMFGGEFDYSHVLLNDRDMFCNMWLGDSVIVQAS